jgi:hypothetical protein
VFPDTEQVLYQETTRDVMRIRVWVGTSRIAGKGLFAAQHIKKGTRIIQYIGQKMSKEETAERLYQAINTFLKAMIAITLMARPCRTKPSVPITPMLQL